MQINAITPNSYSNKNHSANFKGDSYNRKSIDINFKENDAENGSIAASILSVGFLMSQLPKLKGKSLTFKGLYSVAAMAVISLATTGVMTIIKIAKAQRNNAKPADFTISN